MIDELIKNGGSVLFSFAEPKRRPSDLVRWKTKEESKLTHGAQSVHMGRRGTSGEGRGSGRVEAAAHSLPADRSS